MSEQCNTPNCGHDHTELVITPGADFARILRGTNGQQVLVTVEVDEEEKPVLVGAITIRLNGQPTIVRQAFEEVNIAAALTFEGTPKEMLEYADSLISDLTESVRDMYAHMNETEPQQQG
jgi:hypothetical protein